MDMFNERITRDSAYLFTVCSELLQEYLEVERCVQFLKDDVVDDSGTHSLLALTGNRTDMVDYLIEMLKKRKGGFRGLMRAIILGKVQLFLAKECLKVAKFEDNVIQEFVALVEKTGKPRTANIRGYVKNQGQRTRRDQLEILQIRAPIIQPENPYGTASAPTAESPLALPASVSSRDPLPANILQNGSDLNSVPPTEDAKQD